MQEESRALGRCREALKELDEMLDRETDKRAREKEERTFADSLTMAMEEGRIGE